MNLKFLKSLRLLKKIRKENHLVDLFVFFVTDLLKRNRLFSLKINGESIYIRSSTTDLVVAVSSLFSEFRTLATAFPKSHKGLIIDAGGYIGTAAIALSRLYPESTVVTIEPSTDNYAILVKNVGGLQNIHPIHAAVMPNSNSGSIELMNRGTGNWGFTVIGNPDDSAASFIEKVDAISLETLLKKLDVAKIMILKMDIEGGEHALFRDGNWLEKTDVLIIELHERIVAGCEAVFYETNKTRFIYKEDGEKYVSIGKSYFFDQDLYLSTQGTQPNYSNSRP